MKDNEVKPLKLGFIVEGLHDKEKVLKEFPESIIVSCRGTVLNNAIKTAIEDMSKRVDKVYILTDPDEAGNIFAEKLHKLYGYTRIEVDPKQCMVIRGIKEKVGVEYADRKYLRRLIHEALTE